jgi:hypothetical protein
MSTPTDPRRPAAGTKLIRKHEGRKVTVTVLEDAFTFRRKRYSSLSAAASAIAGGNRNGYRFFGLGDGPKRAGK